NVDVIIHDSGVLASHPEFLDENGVSRVRDIVLDGPYYIDPTYFDSNGYTYTRWDGRTGITTTSAHSWWQNGANRSAQFSSIGTVNISSTYTAPRAIGVGSDGTNEMSSGHGTSSASLVAGKNFGLAFEANIWNMSGIGEPAAMSISIEQNYDLMKLFHLHKPVNSETGRKNPTIVNGSWGYQAAFESTDTVSYSFRGGTGTFTGNAAVTDQVTAMKDGLNNQVLGAYRSWSTSSRSNSTDTAANEMMNEGVVYVAAAGNNNQKLGVGSTDPDRLNYMSDVWFSSTDPRSEFPAGTVPCNHRDWMNPQGIGFNSTTDAEFHPVICVGAMDEYVESNLTERKADYSNNGPGIDVWAPADETLAAGTNGVTNYTDFERYDDSRFYDNYFNGTSAAAPVACGLLAIYLETNPTASSREVKTWLKDNGSVIAVPSEYLDQYPDDTQTSYWQGSFNMRDAERRILYNPFANDVIPKMDGLSVTGVNFKVS
ncbi:MAG: S8 family serine peptidase, partial [Candidatus Poseidoniales archaeon]